MERFDAQKEAAIAEIVVYIAGSPVCALEWRKDDKNTKKT